MRLSPQGQAFGEPPITTGTAAMSELAFMDAVLAQLLTGQRQPLVRLTDDDLEAMDEEPIGEHFLQYPFLY